MKKYLCHDCSYTVGRDYLWWDGPLTDQECENKASEESQHGTSTALIDFDLPIPPRLKPALDRVKPRLKPVPTKKPKYKYGINPDDIAV